VVTDFGKPLATIPVDMSPRWVAVSADGRRAYVTLDTVTAAGPSRGAVAVIDTRARALTAVIEVGSMPSGVAVAPDGGLVYVPCWDSAGGHGVLSVIDTAAGKVTGTVVLSGLGGGPTGVAITPDGKQVYVPVGDELDGPDGRVAIVDTATNQVVASLVGSPFPARVTITPDGRFAYVLDTGGNPEVIDIRTHEVTFPLTLQNNGCIAFTPDGRLAYVGADTTDMLEVLDVVTSRLVTILDVFGGHTTDVAVTPDGRLGLVTQRPGNSATLRPLLAIDTASNKLIDPPVTWQGSGDGIAISPDSSTAYVADRRSKALRILRIGP
jgi:DNA-binding beta-propeller fold protein YncE